jgi:hypothetical protein
MERAARAEPEAAQQRQVLRRVETSLPVVRLHARRIEVLGAGERELIGRKADPVAVDAHDSLLPAWH